jgi:3-oxoacyl-[acyl-carrier-protein] synthase-3
VRPTRIADLEAAVAGEPLSDEALASQLGLSAERVGELGCGRTRTSAADGIGPAAIGAELTRTVLSRRGLGVDSVDFVIFGTTTPDVTFPGCSCFLQEMLDLPTVGCLDIRSQFTSFLTGVDTARRFVATGAYDRVLVAAADVPTHVLRYDGVAPELACLMGAAGAVALVEAGESGAAGEILGVSTRIDGSRYREFWCEAPASRRRVTDGAARFGRVSVDDLVSGDIFPRYDAEQMHETAVEHAPEAFLESLSAAGVASVDATVIAHLLPDVADDIARELGDAAGKVVIGEDAYSFGSALPLALFRAVADGKVATGDTVAMVTAGAGASWGSAVVRW